MSVVAVQFVLDLPSTPSRRLRNVFYYTTDLRLQIGSFAVIFCVYATSLFLFDEGPGRLGHRLDQHRICA